MLLLAAIALIAIGPKQLPEVARVIGRFLNDMKKVRDEFTRTIIEARDSTDEKLRQNVEEKNRASELNALTHDPYPSHAFDPIQPTHPSSYPAEPVGLEIASSIADEIKTAEAVRPADEVEHSSVHAHSEPRALDEHKQMSFELSSASNSNSTSVQTVAGRDEPN